MNSLRGKIISVRSQGKLSLVGIRVGDFTLKSIVIETPQTVSYMKEGNEINVLFKETEVVIGKGKEFPISLRNRIPAVVKQIEKGALLSKLVLEFPNGEISSIITTDAVADLAIEVGDVVVAMIKTNEIMLSD
ncbi:MAG TPA: TOBE domain-containing protein [Cyclobacteriaceae bacterium]|nr:TOBE domain-containing protein [Cyclobacteriaceae bacterium]